MSGQEFISRLEAKFGDNIVGGNFENIDPWIEAKPAGLVEICTYLRDESDLRFDMLNCISGVDYFEPDEKKAKRVDWVPHMEVVYHMSSTVHKHNLVVKVVLPRWKNDVQGELPECPSVASVWSTADWHEREVFDLSGVYFVDHPNLCRILCPEDWVGHPLRRDYVQPLEYHGMRGR